MSLFPPSSAEPLRAAMVRFASLEPAYWPDVVSRLAELGFNAIDVPLVWREHDRGDGAFDFESLGRMFDLIAGAGLRAIVRLGPMCAEEAPGLGIPERVLRDRACQARTRRQNPVYVPDSLRFVPLPSFASHAFLDAVTEWIDAVMTALRGTGHDERVVRCIVGHGTHALLRDDPFEIDHHPDAGPHTTGLEAVDAETDRTVRYLDTLRAAVLNAGFPAERIVTAVAGSHAVSLPAHRLAERGRIAVACPSPSAGTLAIWLAVRHAMALGAQHGVHVDLPCGAAPWHPPMRGSHAVAGARAAFAAGAADVTVRMGSGGTRWVGAILSEQGEPRAHAPMWGVLLREASALPVHGDERCVDIVEPEARVRATRAASGVHPLPLGALGLFGVRPTAFAEHDAPWEGETLGAAEGRARSIEFAMLLAGMPFRRTPFVAPERGPDARGGSRVTVEPPGAGLVRVVRMGSREHAVMLSRSTEMVRAIALLAGWRTEAGEPVEAVTSIEPGAWVHWVREVKEAPTETPTSRQTVVEGPAGRKKTAAHTPRSKQAAMMPASDTPAATPRSKRTAAHTPTAKRSPTPTRKAKKKG